MAVRIDISYLGDLHTKATHGPTATQLMTDAPVDNGGKGETFSPTDLAAAALGTCLVTIMGIAAKRHDWDLRGTRVSVVKEMTAVPARRIGALTVTIVVPAGRVTAEADRLLLERAAETCPVKQSLHPDVKVTMRFDWDGAA
jgi:putative redox protein